MQMIVMLYLDVNQQMLDNVILRYTVVVCLCLSLSLSLSLMDSPLPPGVHTEGLHCLWSELSPAQGATGRHVHGGVQVPAAPLTSKQV